MYLNLVGARVEALPVRNHDLWMTIMYTMQYIRVICVTPSNTQHQNMTRLNLHYELKAYSPELRGHTPIFHLSGYSGLQWLILECR
jgi:hypothetical protein